MGTNALTIAVGFKRLAIASAAVLGMGVATLAAASWLIPTERVRDGFQAELRDAAGFELSVQGSVSVSLFPASTVTFTEVELKGDDKAPALVAERLIGRLRLLPLLFGRFEIADIELVQPRITVVISPDRSSNWSTLLAGVSTALNAGAPHPPISFSEIRISQGTVVVQDDARKLYETLSNVDLAFAWPAIAKSFGATGRFVWRLEPIQASLLIGDLGTALSGGRSGAKVRLSGEPFKFAFDGTFARTPSLKIEGAVSADAGSLRDMLRWAGWDPLPPGGGFGRFALKAQADFAEGALSLPQVNLELDGNAADGVLTFAIDRKGVIQGTLAAEQLDLTPYLSNLQLLRGRERDWDRQPIRLDGLNWLDLDMRLSARRTQIGDAQFGRSAMVANLRQGRLSLAIGETQAFGGLAKGGLSVRTAENGAEIELHVQFSDVNLEACLRELFGFKRLDGTGTVGLSLESSGESIWAMTQNLGGSISVAAEKGALTGFNIEQLLRRLERRPLSGGRGFRTGRTPFDKLGVAIKIAGGIATFEDVRFEGEAIRLALAGSASIPARDLDLKGTASLLSANNGKAEFELPFVVQGPWDDPLMLPDPQSLIRRSGAAAPLLEAVRDRRTRDAVRSAIEQLTRPAAEPASGATPSRIVPLGPK